MCRFFSYVRHQSIQIEVMIISYCALRFTRTSNTIHSNNFQNMMNAQCTATMKNNNGETEERKWETLAMRVSDRNFFLDINTRCRLVCTKHIKSAISGRSDQKLKTTHPRMHSEECKFCYFYKFVYNFLGCIAVLTKVTIIIHNWKWKFWSGPPMTKFVHFYLLPGHFHAIFVQEQLIWTYYLHYIHSIYCNWGGNPFQ